MPAHSEWTSHAPNTATTVTTQSQETQNKQAGVRNNSLGRVQAFRAQSPGLSPTPLNRCGGIEGSFGAGPLLLPLSLYLNENTKPGTVRSLISEVSFKPKEKKGKERKGRSQTPTCYPACPVRGSPPGKENTRVQKEGPYPQREARGGLLAPLTPGKAPQHHTCSQRPTQALAMLGGRVSMAKPGEARVGWGSKATHS